MMITSTQTNTNASQLLLEQELQCFHEIMTKTQQILDDSDSVSLSSILSLLDEREFRIEHIKYLESEVEKLRLDKETTKSGKLVEQISIIAKSLIVTDAKLFDILQLRKMDVVKEMGKIADNRGKASNAMRNIHQTSILDTRDI